MKTPLRPFAAVTGILLAVALTTACSSESESGAAPATRDAAGQDLTVSHVHGLGIDPADGQLYVATHEGVVAVAGDGEARRVGDKADYMGFTVVGARTFLGSGHPEPGSAGPANRGLIESTDSGKTWKTRSLAGTTDFHALKYAHDTVYGYDSTNGVLRVSADRTTWDSRAELAALDLAVSPEDPDLVLATTESGVLRSTDGGRTFGAPSDTVMGFLSWPRENVLYGVDGSGGLHRSDDGGGSWTASGTVPGGQPQALTAVDADRVLAATQDGVYESRDGGRTFTERLPISGSDH
ncbi:F510_1955 family glycosylhydrolase [Streptomyces sp. NPDC059477]|uniref:F510_1955 family glycosylhydrolase n=1 Tax=Streptomyces sp. NPDC059477 TaxID=3346847 RepID=UPI0036C2094C